MIAHSIVKMLYVIVCSVCIAWIGNQATLFTFLLGPTSAAMAARMCVQPVIITGAIIFTTDMLFTAGTNEMWPATFTYSVMDGLGASMVYTPVVGILHAYFDKRKSFCCVLCSIGFMNRKYSSCNSLNFNS